MAAPVAAGAIVGSTILNLQAQGRRRQAERRRLQMNASFFREQARFIEETGERQETVFKRKADIVFGEQVSAFSAGGVDVGSGSALSLLGETRANQKEQIQDIRRETAFRVRLAELRAQGADIDEAEIRRNAPLETMGTLLDGIGRVGSVLNRRTG